MLNNQQKTAFCSLASRMVLRLMVFLILSGMEENAEVEAGGGGGGGFQGSTRASFSEGGVFRCFHVLQVCFSALTDHSSLGSEVFECLK